MDQPRNTHGGRRRNAGRKTERSDLVVAARTLMLDDMTMRRLRALGGGNASMGARKAADAAYDLFQAGKIT
jgi:hypothetical protein